MAKKKSSEEKPRTVPVHIKIGVHHDAKKSAPIDGKGLSEYIEDAIKVAVEKTQRRDFEKKLKARGLHD